MNAKRLYMIWIRMVMLSVLITSISGCDRQGRYKVLTFFFTGVPPLEEEQQKGAEWDKNLAAGEVENATFISLITIKLPVDKKPAVGAVEKATAPQVTVYTHPLTAAWQCDRCHRTTANFGLFGQRARQTVFRKGGLPPGPLVVPRNELCVACHNDKSAAEALTQGLWLHPTSAKGDCYACHDPHQSTNRSVLLANPRKICTPCHTEAEMMPKVKDREAHRQTADCLSCHNPHLGKDRLLLKKDYKEVKHPVEPIPGFPGFPAEPDNLPAGSSTTKSN